MSDNTLARFGSYYHDFRRNHPQVAREFRSAIEELLTDGGVTYDRVSTRLKEWSSLKAKARKRDGEGTLIYPDPRSDIHDMIGVRVTTFHSTEIPVALSVLQDSFAVRKSVDKAAETRISGGFGYGSHHLILEVDDTIEELQNYQGLVFEVQVRTVLQHAWAEFEHDIRYKRAGVGPQGEIDPEVDRKFTLAAGLIELADQQFDQIAALKDNERVTDESVELTAETLPGVLAMLIGNRFPRPRSENYRFLEDILHANGINTVASLRDLLNAADIEVLLKVMRYRFHPGQIRIIDDLLLKKFGGAHISATVGQDSQSLDVKRHRQLKRKLEQMQAAHILAAHRDSPAAVDGTSADSATAPDTLHD
ncbi:GTP pyrophosphokinase [Corynebacterium pacaense]|uniref:GTP pyrophosphokinase n=1 Tax=Corynebacterium pacaense TaxID=1816684 RepID=UPI0009BC11BF|nr:GTP pyrophosphokinase [Corynebacterium pacaense]